MAPRAMASVSARGDADHPGGRGHPPRHRRPRSPHGADPERPGRLADGMGHGANAGGEPSVDGCASGGVEPSVTRKEVLSTSLRFCLVKSMAAASLFENATASHRQQSLVDQSPTGAPPSYCSLSRGPG